MRAIGTAVLAMAGVMAATPALAADATSTADAVALVAVPQTSPATLGARLSALPVLTAAIATDPAAKPTLSAIRKGFGTSATSFYPMKDSGFHFSVATRVSTRPGKVIDTPWAPLLWTPRGSGLKTMRRMSPAVFAGFDHSVGDGMTLGLDAGMVKGRIGYFGRGPRAAMEGGRFDRGGHGDHGGQGFNPLARVTFGYHF